MAQGNLKYQYANLSIAEKLIVVNVIVFIVDGLLKALFGFSIMSWFELPKDFSIFITQPWSIISYSFFHGSLGHVFWNMMLLYFSGRIFLNLFGNKRFLNVYFLGVIAGGLAFLLSYNVFPTLVHTNTSLIGASAGVTAILIFICTYIPNQEVRLFIINVKLWYIGAFVVLTDLIRIPTSGNVGGHLAHLGGAALGYFYARQLLNGTDIGSGFEKLVDGIVNIFRKKEKKSPLKTVYRRESVKKQTKPDYTKESKQRKVDGILDKISKSGYESLSQEEKDFLFKAGKEN
ncbi:rhomboid family intramembrane serine protease [uncultured Maribacter sp.]|uniref:rhomboid family protein n=1 Tax=uncultured Maribacter sp. TaxID=431308 RepID=UPI00262B9A48|nr:rhomboid family intramembrane serine protease [uncultured Maribacter sp.]